MLIPLTALVCKYNIQFKGILHVGAHECEELVEYEKFLDRGNILWVEAMQDKVTMCRKRYPNVLIENAVVSDTVEKVCFHVANNGQSSSFLELGLHSTFHPEIKYQHSFECNTTVLKDLLPKYNIPYNFVNLDIQGAELKALKGMHDYLHTIDYLYTEVNSDYVYQNCALISELDEYLLTFGLKRVETVWCGDYKWGDAFYIRDVDKPVQPVPKISLCIPTYKRFDQFLLHNLVRYLQNPYIDEIVISDENGEDAQKIALRFQNEPKLKVYTNSSILGPFLNKNRVVSLASNEWICLMDSDNYASPAYFEAWIAYIKSYGLSSKKVYLPMHTNPQSNHAGFNYTQFQHLRLDGKTIVEYGFEPLSMLLNTGNYVFHKKNYLDSNRFLDHYHRDGLKYGLDVQDVVFKALLLCLNHSTLVLVPDMSYDHVVHKGSYVLNNTTASVPTAKIMNHLISTMVNHYDTVDPHVTLHQWQQSIKPIKEWLYNCSEYIHQTDEWVSFPIGMGWSIMQQQHISLNALQYGKHDKIVLCAINPITDQRRRPNGINRIAILNTLQSHRIENKTLDPSAYFKELPHYKFVISPEGNGIDCHRHYEALMAGCIPIVEDCDKIREKYKGCPVLYTKDYSEITEAYLIDKYNEMVHATYDFSRLLLTSYSEAEKIQIKDNGNYWSTRLHGSAWYTGN